MQSGLVSIWTWKAIDADTKLVISYTIGDRRADTAKAFMQDVASRINSWIQLTTDGHRVYADAVEDAFGANIDYAMLVKIYGASNENPESRYSPATCIGCRTGVLAEVLILITSQHRLWSAAIFQFGILVLGDRGRPKVCDMTNNSVRNKAHGNDRGVRLRVVVIVKYRGRRHRVHAVTQAEMEFELRPACLGPHIKDDAVEPNFIALD